ncbi:MAG: DUF1015 family protein [Acidimicrobiia bacterium]
MTRWLLPVAAGLVKPDQAAEVISPPYDLLTPPERARYMREHPRSFLNGTPSEEDDPNLHLEARRLHAARYLQRELENQTWSFPGRGLFVLRIESNGHVQTGVVGDVPADAFPGVIRPHEHTRPRRVTDLANYLDTVGYGSSPVGLTYRRQPEIDAMVSLVTATPPALDVSLPDGEHQQVWFVDNPEVEEGLVAAFSDVPTAYIIDGHHRVVATVQRNAVGQGGKFLAAIFPDDDLRVYPFHRWVDGPFTLDAVQPKPQSPRRGQVVAVTRDGEQLLDLENRADEDDVSALTRVVLGPRLGVGDDRSDPRLVFVPGYPDNKRLRQMVTKRGGVGFVLHPPSVATVMATSDRSGVMPPKATFFAPKPRSGVFLVKR